MSDETSTELVSVLERDHDAFFAMLAEYIHELDAYDPDGPEPPEISARRRERVLDELEDRELLWIEHGGARAGLIMLRYDSAWLEDDREIVVISEFYVVPEHRRCGIGRRAVEQLASRLTKAGTWELQADILAMNEPARAFWASVGFELQMLQTARRLAK